MSTAQLTMTREWAPEPYDDNPAADACRLRVHRLTEAGIPHQRDGLTLTWSVRRESWTEATTITFRDDEIPGQTDLLEEIK